MRFCQKESEPEGRTLAEKSEGESFLKAKRSEVSRFRNGLSSEREKDKRKKKRKKNINRSAEPRFSLGDGKKRKEAFGVRRFELAKATSGGRATRKIKRRRKEAEGRHENLLFLSQEMQANPHKEEKEGRGG